MITLEALRDALLTDKPWTALDYVVRAEQAAGRRVKDIRDEFKALIEPVRDAVELSDDADDAMMDTLDALEGNCAPRWRYADAPELIKLPSEDEIAALPRWARVAFAARCARRVFPLFTHFWPEAPEKTKLVVEWACLLPELVAAGEMPEEDEDIHVANTAHAAHSADLEAAAHGTASYAAATASFAAEAAFQGLIGQKDEASRFAAGAAKAAAEPLVDITPALRRDYGRIAYAAAARRWSDSDWAPYTIFGPLWPEGPPQGWPTDLEPPTDIELPLELVVREGPPNDAAQDEAVNLFNALNRYHIARGGGRLTADILPPLVAAFAPAEV